jgi:salicylate synthase
MSLSQELRPVPAADGVGAVGAAGAARVVRGLSGPYVLYEHAEGWSLGVGARHEVIVRASGVELRTEGRTVEVRPADLDTPARIQELLAGVLAPGERAYGWAAFELAHLLAGTPAPSDRTLLHLVVPTGELRSGPAGVTASGNAAELLPALAAEEPEPPTTPPAVDLAAGGPSYRVAVARAVADIRAGRLAKVILSRVVDVPGPVDLGGTYAAGRRGNTPARSFLLDLGGRRAAGFSPEIVVAVSAAGEVTTQPLAGTRALSGDREEDGRLRAELLDDPKEVFEHAISVREARAELDELCAPGTVRVTGFMDVTPRGSVQHLASRVTGSLAAGRTAWDALARLFPAITASGVPKRAAVEMISALEPEPRGMYAGAVLTVDADGALDAALTLRAVYQRGERTWLRAGAGIVEASDPARELEETCEKLRSVSRFLVAAPVAAPVRGV